jgi:hypothetical protein
MRGFIKWVFANLVLHLLSKVRSGCQEVLTCLWIAQQLLIDCCCCGSAV